MVRKIAIVALAVLLVVGTTAALAANDAGTSATESAEVYDVQDDETTVAENQTANLTVANQTTVNGTDVIVNINETYLPEGGFVAITVTANDTTEPNLTAPIVGNTTFLEPGLHQNETITLNRSILNQTLDENETLMAVAFRDVDGNQQFDPTMDEPLVIDDEPVAEPVRVTVEGLLPDEQLGNETTTTTEM